MTHFYLTLPSNSSSKYYPDNTLTRFVTKLHSSISLTGQWEVGLCEIAFPRTWYTVDEVGSYFEIYGSSYGKLKIHHGYYDSVHDVVTEMNKACEDEAKRNPIFIGPIFECNEITRIVSINMPNAILVVFPRTLMDILGFETDLIHNTPVLPCSIKGTRVCDIDRGLNSLFIYCDLLESVPVGDTKAPLLRIVDAKGKNGEIIRSYFDEPRYVPLQRKQFDSIEIDIRDDIGNVIPFESGKLIVTLHFRLSSNPYFL